MIWVTQSYAGNTQRYSSIEEFVTDQKIIRITVDHQPGFGNQAASVTVMDRLRQMGFQGTYEFVYPDNITDKITLLFDLPSNIPSDFYDSKKKIRFIKLTEYVKNLKNKSVEPFILGLAGAFYKGPYDPIQANHIDTTGLGHLELYNFANFLNLNVFVKLDNYPNYQGYSYINVRNDPKDRDIIDNNHTFFTMPVANLDDVKKYLANDPHGQKLLQKKPALKIFIDGMERQNFNVLPAYGWTLQKMYDGRDTNDFPGNILQIIAGTRYAQLKGSDEMHKPLIIPVFYNYDEEANQLIKLVQSDNWGQYEKSGAVQARKIIKELDLSNPQVFSVANIADPYTIKRLQTLRSGQILLLSMGPLPKTIFDGLFTNTGPNIWPQIREGASSFSSLVLTGRPHIRCRGDDAAAWEIGYDLVHDQALKTRLQKLYSGGFCQSMQTWVDNTNVYQVLGELIIEGNNLNSPFSHYFQDLKIEAEKPENDRIRLGLEKAMKIVNEN